MAELYPPWIEIPVGDMDEALAFYRSVFGLAETPIFDEPPLLIALLRPSGEPVGAPGVSLVRSPGHRAGEGVTVNYHLGGHAALDAALAAALACGGRIAAPIAELGEGVRYALVRDCAGNPLALSSYEPPA